MGSTAHIAIFCVGLTILGSCSADQSTGANGSTSAEVRPDSNTTVSANSEWPKQAGLENDLTFCFSKAIAIHEQLNPEKAYAKNQLVTFSINSSSDRLQTVLKKLSARTGGFQEKPTSELVIPFESSMYDGSEMLEELNKYEWKIKVFSGRRYKLQFHDFVYGDIGPFVDYTYEFDRSANSYKAVLNYSSINDDDEWVERKISIENDVIVK